jgi:ribose transport system substrate-binding protein
VFKKAKIALFVVLTICLVIGMSGIAAAAAKKEITVGFSIKTMHSPYYVAVEQAMQDLSKEKGFKIISVNAGADVVKQQADIEDLIARKVDVLIVDSQDPIAIIAISKNVAAAGIPLFLLNTTVDPSATYVTLVQSNNVAIGSMVGEWVGNKVSGEIKIGLLSGNPGNMVGYGRRSGFFQGLAEAQLIKSNTTNFRVLTQGWGSWSAEGGLKAAEDMLVAAPDINVIFAENDSMALGAVTAIKNAGKEKQITVVGIDGQREALALIKEGTYGASGLNSPIELAKTTVDIALRYMAGERGFPALVNTTPACVSAENVDQY